jgi:predicted Zn-dependent protease with MMP-like domain
VDDRHARHRRGVGDRRRRPSDGFRALTAARFERLVEDAIATLPGELLRELDRVDVVVSDVPPPLGASGDPPPLGRYEPARRQRPSARSSPGTRPSPPAGRDRLTLFRRPLELRATTRIELAELVRSTVVHELAHHLGIDDDRLDELGWD